MGLLTWIIFGGLAGWISSLVSDGDGRGIIGNVFLGIIGAFVGGIIVNLIGGDGITGFNLYSMLVAVAGSLGVLFIARKIA